MAQPILALSILLYKLQRLYRNLDRALKRTVLKIKLNKGMYQYKLDIPICLKQKLFFSYHVLTADFRIFCVENLLNVNLPLNLCDAHLLNLKILK